MTKSLIVVQGPTQALAAIAALAEHPSLNFSESEKNNTHFLVGNVCAGPNSTTVINATNHIIKSFGFNHLFNTLNLDIQYYSEHNSFDRYCEELQICLQHVSYQTIYVCRCMALINEAVLKIYHQSTIICYGDGFGGLDNGKQKWAKPINPNGFKIFNKCIAVAPFEENYCGSQGKPVKTRGVDSLRNAIKIAAQSCKASLDTICKEISQHRQNLGLITTSNLTESGSAQSLEQEINFYLEYITTCVPRESQMLYFIKGHPRQTMDQAQLLTAKLQALGLNCIHLPIAAQVPTELLITFLRPAEIIPILSSSGYVARLLENSISVHYSPSAETLAKIWLDNRLYQWHKLTQRLQALTLLASYPWERCVSYARYWLNSAVFRGTGISFPALSPATRVAKSERFARYQASLSSLCFVAALNKKTRVNYLHSFIK